MELLHFAWAVVFVKCILVTSVCLCLSTATCPHYRMDPDVTWGNGRGPPSCALLGRFAIGAWVLLLWQHSTDAKCQRECLYLFYAWFAVFGVFVSVIAFSWLVAWHSGRTSLFGRWTFPVLCSSCSWWMTTYVGKLYSLGLSTRPTQPFIPSRLINE